MKNRLAAIWMLSCLVFAGVGAQVEISDAFEGIEIDSVIASSPTTFALMPVFNPWLVSTNPAGHQFDPEIMPGRMDLNYSSRHGDYKKVQRGDTMQLYSFQTERYKRINRTHFYGKFSYDKSFERGVNYTNVNDPYRETPFQLIDTKHRNDIVDREFFNLRGDISTPLFWRLSWGLSADLDVGLASQNRDPRPKNKVLDLTLSQGFLLDLDYVKLGVNGLYSYYNEDIEVDIIKKNTQMLFLQLLGFDTYTYHVAASYNRLYKRNTYGGEGQLNLELGSLNTLFGGKFLYFEELVEDGRKAGDASWSYMKGDSWMEGNEISIFNTSTLRMDNSMHALNASYDLRYMVGSEAIERLENVGEAGAVDWVEYGFEEKYGACYTHLDLDYAWYWMKDAYRKSYEFRLGADYFGREQAYYLPDKSDQFMNRILSLGFGKTMYYGRHECSLGIEWQRKKNVESERRFGAGDFVIDNIMTYDFAYLTSDYNAYSVDLSYAVSLNRLFEKYFLRCSYTKYTAEYYNTWMKGKQQTIFKFSTGVIF